MIAEDAYPGLDVERYIGDIERLAIRLRARIPQSGGAEERVVALNQFLYGDLGYWGNTEDYYDPRNSYLNEVLERRTGIPITMSVVYMEVARRAGLRIDGVNFPGHFLVRCCEGKPRKGAGLIIDPFHGGALLTEHDCRMLLQRHVGDEVAYSKSLLATATRPQVISRMLLNLKRLYVHMRSFPQARDVTEMLLALTPSSLSELRDRGLLAYHLNDFTSALRDLQAYLKLSSMSELDDDTREEQEQIWEHVKTLRRRVASLN
jgi:regulator of sirC expression with transglutaminase-like and TPR domain